MTTTFIYVAKEFPADEVTTHLAEEAEWAWGDYGKTLCGLPLEGLAFGDETQSGLVATCQTCKGIAHKTNWPQEAPRDQPQD